MTHHNRTHGYFESQFFGGVLAYTKEQYKKINGFSIEYVNWGQEDDDLYIRFVLIHIFCLVEKIKLIYSFEIE